MNTHKTTVWLVAVLMAVLAIAPVAAQVKDYRDIKYPKLPAFEIPKPEVFTMDNGMTVFLLEDHELPLINVFVRVRTGSNYDPAGKTGLGDIFGQVQREGGTTSMTGDEMDDFLEARAASIETFMGGDMGFGSMNCLKDDFDEIFALFGDVLRRPAFAEDKIELAKVQNNTFIARRNDDISGITSREFPRLIYGKDSPLSRLIEYETVAAVQQADLVDWHKKYYHPNNIYLGVVGDFDSESMKGKIREVFGSWEKGLAFAEPEVPYEKAVKPGTYFIEKEDVTQAYVRLGHIGMNAKDPDYFAVQVMNEVLGGSFASRLFSNVRSEKGLAYSVWGGVGSSFVRQGIFQVAVSTKSETMSESVAALREEVNGIINNPATADELKRAKESILNSFVFNYDSRGKILAQQMTYAYYGMPEDYLEQYRANIEKVTAEDVARVAKKYIHPDRLVLLVVGKSADFDKPVSTFGDVAALDITIPEPPDTRPEIEATAENLEAGGSLFQKVARHISNGATEKVSTAKASYKLAVNMGGQSMSLGQELSMMLPNKMRQAISTPMGEQVVVLNGDQGFMSGGGQKMPMPEERIKEGLQTLGRDLLILTGNIGDPEIETVAAGTGEVDGKPCEIVSVTFLGSESRLFVDEDGKVVKQSYQGKHPFRGTPGMFEVMFSEYTSIEGRMLPKKQVMLFEGEELATITLDSIEVNPELDPVLFEVTN